MCGQAGLDLPPLGHEAREGINGILKGFGWAANPADVTGFANSGSFPQIMEHMLDDPRMGTLVVASAGADAQAQQVISQRAGRPAADLAELEDTLVHVSLLATHLVGRLTVLDTNPLMVLPSG